MVEVPGQCPHPNTSSPAPSSTRTGSLSLLQRAAALKEAPRSSRALEGRTVALVFNKPSTRTRTSFESGVFELGGHPMILRPDEMQLTRGESIRDTAYILSRHASLIGLRTGDEDEINGFAEHATVPVVNMLSPLHHPCQALADLQTMQEALGSLDGRVLTYVGDGNNVARSLAVVGALAGVEVRVAAPSGYQLPDGRDARGPVRGPGRGRRRRRRRLHRRVGLDERRRGLRRRPPRGARRRTRSTTRCSTRPRPDAFALHCLPAHPGEEITESVLYGSRQRIWDQAENRRHAQKALLELLVSTDGQDG